MTGLAAGTSQVSAGVSVMTSDEERAAVLHTHQHLRGILFELIIEGLAS
jgi:hypothetical protein